MTLRTSFVLCLTLGCLPVSALATETWNCTVQASASWGGVGGTPGQVQIQIAGDDMLWIIPAWLAPGINRGIPSETQHRHVLLDNDVGIVASVLKATTSTPKIFFNGHPAPQLNMLPNPMIEAYVVVLDKKSGALRVGIVGTTKVTDLDTGNCQRAEPPTTPSQNQTPASVK